MTIVDDARTRMALLVSAITLGGCAVGTAYVRAPDRLPSTTLPPLARPITFDVCTQPDPGPNRQALARRIERGLSLAGVRADLAAAGSPVDLTVAVRDEGGPSWSAIVSFVTFSVVPGYSVDRKTLDVDLAWRDAAQVSTIEHLRYQSRTYGFIWLPLVLSLEFFWSMDDGWESPKMEDAGLKQMVERLGDDIRARLGREDVRYPVSGAGGVACPSATAPDRAH